jgi:hypothetical protein
MIRGPDRRRSEGVKNVCEVDGKTRFLLSERFFLP